MLAVPVSFVAGHSFIRGGLAPHNLTSSPKLCPRLKSSALFNGALSEPSERPIVFAALNTEVRDATTKVSGFNELETRYSGFLVDLCGVIHNGFESLPHVDECLSTLRSKGAAIVFLSNSSRGSEFIVPGLRKKNIDIRPGELITPGDLVRNQIRDPTDAVFMDIGRSLFNIGRSDETGVLDGLEDKAANRMEAADYVLMTYLCDAGQSTESVEKSLEKALRLKMPMVCPNSDVIACHGDKMRLCPGYFAQMYEEMGGEVHYYGKPYSPIYEAGLERLRRLGVDDKSKVLMVGDNLLTDVKGANVHEIDSMLVATGIYRNELKDLQDMASLRSLSDKFGSVPTYAAAGFRW